MLLVCLVGGEGRGGGEAGNDTHGYLDFFTTLDDSLGQFELGCPSTIRHFTCPSPRFQFFSITHLGWR